tara:strand:+ start:256 stop:522 length:267 start_codon:yes stop_codon:yes gene_type:complete
MRHIKNWIAPIKIFMAVIISTILSLLTMIAVIPVGYLFNIGNSGGFTIYAIIQLVYLVSTLNYFFSFKAGYYNWKRREFNRGQWSKVK